MTPDATQSFTLTVDQAPTITSADSTTTSRWHSGHVHGDDHRVPDRRAERDRSAALGRDASWTTATAPPRSSGTPAAGTGGTYALTITAANGVPRRHPELHADRRSGAGDHQRGQHDVHGRTAGTFTVTTTGFPTAALSETGALPTGVTFVDNGDGTATLAGTPAAGTGGTYVLTITAANGVVPTPLRASR